MLLWFNGLGASGVTAAPAPTVAWPPADYRLDELSLRITWDLAHGQPPQRVVLHGNGRGALDRRGQPTMFQMEPKAILEVVNGLYRLRFFDLPSLLPSLRSLFMHNDGSVGTQSMTMHDATTTTVCFLLPRFEKCVAYKDQPPRELEEWVARLRAEAESRVALK